MTNRRYAFFLLARSVFTFVNRAIPKRVTNWIHVIVDLVRCARWGAHLKAFGRGSYIHPNVVIHGADNVEIGAFVSIGEFSYIWGNGGVFVGDNTLIAAGCQITTLSHDENALIYRDSIKSARVILGNNVWLGFGVRVMPGVSIGDNSIIGAGSVVTKDVPANVVAMGSPAKAVRALAQHSLAPSELV